ncbi:methyltransferase domain-containing protein [Auraticoccus sp. F435]|uniref:Methyltransferase domain-containing protein n=1 Tax=Auraticoccus cholistanensis TaxID=2656650 RepID=A0A6A9UYN2_9ACTN|nr:methyltransferase domain-containing protein [Auraticoccus cholistanensis]MVA76934.1 methyltransferase domain-containing protein [Auraticoccus cholistanensis]
MAPTRRSLHPAGALTWLVEVDGAAVLDLAHGSAVFARELQAVGHHVTVLDRQPAPASTPGPQGGPATVLGQPESLPFKARQFDAVTASDTLQHFAPGLALPEIARVLRPGGTLSVVQTTRDDTVPWVRRLARMVQEVDPGAMRGDYGQEAVELLVDSPFFTAVEHRDFRNWIPITRSGLVDMVARRPAVQAVEEDRRDALLADVAALFDSLARPLEPLMLPFQSSCWRARPVPGGGTDEDDDVLQFSL